MRLSDFDDWATAHHGIVTFAASGLSRSAWYRAIRAGTLQQLHPYVARIPGTADTPEQRIIAAVAGAGAGALASHRSAARLWGIPRPDGDPVDVLFPDRRRDVRLDGVVTHRPRDRQRLRPRRRYGIACTDVVRTILDLGAVDPAAVSGAVGHAVTNRLATLEALEQAVEEHATPGRHGIVAARRAIAGWSIDRKPADSVLEAAFARLARQHRLPPLEFHPMVEGYEIDFRVVGTRVLVECDGWAYHGRERTQFERDRSRDARLTAAGWIVLRFTYRAVTRRPRATAERIRETVARWSPAPTPPSAA